MDHQNKRLEEKVRGVVWCSVF